MLYNIAQDSSSRCQVIITRPGRGPLLVRAPGPLGDELEDPAVRVTVTVNWARRSQPEDAGLILLELGLGLAGGAPARAARLAHGSHVTHVGTVCRPMRPASDTQ